VHTITAVLAVVAALLAVSGPGPGGSGIQRATSSESARDGHFSDPYRIGPATTDSSSPLTFSGTFNEIITCQGTIKPGCFTPSTISVGLDASLKDQVAAWGNEIRATKAHHITRAPDGSWQMVLAAVVAPKGSRGTGSKGGWNVILHAHPTSGGDSSAMPLQWTADTLLVGSFAHSAPADYDGKYISDGGKLYLVYEKELSAGPNIFGLVAQPMDNWTRPSAVPPVTLLEPQASGGGLTSENYFEKSQHGGFRLVEVGNIIKVDGKYLMLYSVGSYKRPVYKIGVAWSDTLLPGKGSAYRKVRMPDTKGVWGRKGADEVDYLLQSQVKDWPNYAGGSVQAPGVGSLVQRDGHWYLFFAGYDPKERVTGSNHTFDASHRQPYYVPVKLNVPSDTTVKDASDAQLRSWITPELSSE
jgi:hypothetical protein